MEVLIGVLVFSVGIVGLAGLQVKSLSRSVDSERDLFAMQAITALAGDIRTNPEGFREVSLTSGATDHYSRCQIGDRCSPRRRAESSFADWTRFVQSHLPGAVAVVCRDDSPADGDRQMPACDGGSHLSIKLWWSAGADFGDEGQVQQRSLRLAAR